MNPYIDVPAIISGDTVQVYLDATAIVAIVDMPYDEESDPRYCNVTLVNGVKYTVELKSEVVMQLAAEARGQ